MKLFPTSAGATCGLTLGIMLTDVAMHVPLGQSAEKIYFTAVGVLAVSLLLAIEKRCGL